MYHRYGSRFRFLARTGVRGVRRATDDDSRTNTGVDFKVKKMQVGSKKINLTLWDTAGQEKFRSLTSSYYRGTEGIVLGTSNDSLDLSRSISLINSCSVRRHVPCQLR